MDSSKRERLLMRYVESFPAKVKDLREGLELLRKGDAGAVKRLRTAAHKLAGSGGSYGMPELSELGHRAELASDAQLESAIERLIEMLGQIAELRGGRGKPVILIVEDDIDTATLLRQTLEQLAANTHIATSALAAEALMGETSFDMVVLDLVLPDVDGRELLARMRANVKLANTPVIVLTARGGRDAMRDCIAAGVDYFLEKPLDPPLLRAAVETAWNRLQGFQRESRHDHLTGLLNRAGLHEEVEKVTHLAARSGFGVSLALLDLDGFKKVNDEFGHAMGDEVLSTFARILQTELRASDVAARWGGEEFVALFPDTDTAGALRGLTAAARALREAIFVSDDGDLSGVTFSGGVVELSSDEPFADALARADRLLYAAKLKGNVALDEAIATGAKAKRVLLAEDDADAASMVRTVLEEEGIRVTHCADGEAAMHAAATNDRFDLVLLDWQMPGLLGDAVLERLRASPDYRRTPIVMLTSLGDEESIERAFEMGADDYLQKPFRPRELAARLRRLLRGPRR